MSIKTILFDLDGTLIDTNELIHNSFEHTFTHYGYSFTREEILQFNGPPLIQTFTDLNPELAEEMITTYRKHNLEHHNDYVQLFPNVKETLATLHQAGIKMGIVSAKMRPGVQLGLKVTGIDSYFDTIVSVDDVQNPKPHPEPVLKGLRNLDGDTESAIMVGDNYHDIESGKNAGLQTVAVAWSLKGKEYLQDFKPTYMIEDMRDLLPIVGV
ncbi:pyrophosphatase PpaX [Pseudogracilibacillus sp. SE30717A]|uniref:pyrophosphatase PpaX n=1 Tax=Pseudogracilibacillus sp. SE30717A TaxID=3098293 RepID=UPI00300E5D63